MLSINILVCTQYNSMDLLVNLGKVMVQMVVATFHMLAVVKPDRSFFLRESQFQSIPEHTGCHAQLCTPP